jgi:hypothetical protein
VGNFKGLGTTITDQNVINEEVKRNSDSGKACYHSLENLSLLCCLKRKIKIYKTIALPAV